MSTHLLSLTPYEFCRATDACAEGRDWAIMRPDMATVWDACPRADWMLWMLNKLGHVPQRELRLFAVWCARRTPLGDGRVTGDLMTDPRSRAALDVAERYAEGDATANELRSAYRAATTATYAVAYHAAAYHAAAAAAAATAAASDASAYADSYAAYGDSYAAYADSHAAANAAQAGQLRRMIPNPFRAKETKP